MTAEEVDLVRMRKIKEQEAHVRELEVAYKTQQEATKEAREELSLAIGRLRMLIRGEVEDQLELDLDSEEPTQQVWDTLLSTTRLEDIVTLTKSQRQKFGDIGVVTVKQFELLRAGDLPGYSGNLTDLIKNYAVCSKLEDGVLDWCDRQRIERGQAREKGRK